MRFFIGIDVAKLDHFAVVVDEAGSVLAQRKLTNDPTDLAGFIDELRRLGGERRVALDVVGGMATMLVATLLAAGERLVYVTGIAVNRARDATPGGQHKSDPKDARVIAEQARMRNDLRVLELDDGVLAALRVRVRQRQDLRQTQTRTQQRLHELLHMVHPGLEAMLDLTTVGGLTILASAAGPGDLVALGVDALEKKLREGRVPKARHLAERVVEVSVAQRVQVPGSDEIAAACVELAAEAVAQRAALARLDARITELVGQHADGPLLCTLPGMGPQLAAEFITIVGNVARFRSPDALASAAGLAPALRQSGKLRFNQRSRRGDRRLKSVLYQAAFSSLRDPASRAFYERKRNVEKKRHTQAVVALARRRVNVIWAMLQKREPYRREVGHAA